MASSININQNNNTVSLQDQNRKITIKDNIQEKTINVTQPVTNVVNVVTLGPTGPEGPPGSADILGNITASGNISASGIVTGLTASFNRIETVTSGKDLDFISTDDIKLRPTDNVEIRPGNALKSTFFAEGGLRVNSDSSVSPESSLDVNGDITSTHITASGNISASGTVVGSNVTSTNATDITSLKTQAPFLFTLQTSSTGGNTIFSESIAGFTPAATIGGNVGVIYFSTQSANGVDMTGIQEDKNPTEGGVYFNDIGSQITLISTSSGKFVRVKINNLNQKVQQFEYFFQQLTMITGSGGFPDQGDTVEMRWDNSAGVGTIQGTGITNADTSINKIEIAYRTSSGIYAPNVDPTLGDESPVSLTSAVYTIPFISKSADLTINSLTTVGNVSSSAGTGSFEYMILPNIPTSDPGVAGAVFRNGLDLRISAG